MKTFHFIHWNLTLLCCFHFGVSVGLWCDDKVRGSVNLSYRRNIGPPTQKISLKPNGRPVKYLPKQDQQLSADGIQLLQDQQVAVREIYEIVPARKWKGEENQMTKIVFIGHNLNEDVLNDSFRTCMTPDAAEGGETDGVKKEANGHHSHGPLDSKNDELTSGQEDQALVGLGTGLASLDAKKQKAKGKAAA
nr:hypothetical protein CFP56_59928 [Quercus suber]